MFRLHFQQVHRIAIAGTILMGRNGPLLNQEEVLGIQEIAFRSAVMNDAIEFLADVGHTIIAGRKFAKFHLTMVFVAKRTDVGSVCYSGHEKTSSCYLKAQVNTLEP